MTKIALFTIVSLAVGCAGASDRGHESTPDPADPAEVDRSRAATQTEPPAEPQGVTRESALRSNALDRILSGKTHRGAAGPAGRYALYFAPDGAARGRMGETELAGRWSREGADTFCIEWRSPPLPRGCTFVVWPEGEDGVAYDAATGEQRNTIDELLDGEHTDL